MNNHKNIRLMFPSRLKMVDDIAKHGVSDSEAAVAHGVSTVTASKRLDDIVRRRRCAVGQVLAASIVAKRDLSERFDADGRA